VEVLSEVGTPRLNQEKEEAEEDLKSLNDKLEENVKVELKEAEENDVVSEAEDEAKEADEKMEELTEKADSEVDGLLEGATDLEEEAKDEIKEKAADVTKEVEDISGKAEDEIKPVVETGETSDSGAGESEPEGTAEEENAKNSELALLAGAVAPSIAAGGTVFATAAKRKVSRKGVPAHLRNVRSKLSKTFHENERYNFDSAKDGEDDSGVEESQNSSIAKKSPGRSDSPVKRVSRLNQDGRRLPRSRSVPKGTFTFSNSPSPSSSETTKRVPMNKIVLGKSTLPNLRNIKSKVGSMMNTNYKPGGGQVKIVSKPVRKPKPRTKSEGSEPPGKAKEDEKEDSEEKPKQKKSRRSDLKDLKARVSTYSV
jgi:hypothetical protein